MSDYYIGLREWCTSLLPSPLMVIIDPKAQFPLWVRETMCEYLHISALSETKNIRYQFAVDKACIKCCWYIGPHARSDKFSLIFVRIH